APGFLVGAVDLRLLQAVGVVDVDRLPLGVKIDSAEAAFAMAVAGGFYTAKGQGDFRANRRRVDGGYAGVKVADGGEGTVDVARVERRREAVGDVVGNFDGVLEAVAGDQTDHRAKDFFLRDAHPGRDIAKYRRLDEVPVLPVAVFDAAAAGQEPGALRLADVDVA